MHQLSTEETNALYGLQEKGMGCTDTGGPEVPVWVLRNMHELMQYAKRWHTPEEFEKLWKGFPAELRAEYNYSNWTYVPSEK